MPPEKAAQIFHDWANAEGLMPDGPIAPVTATSAELATVNPITEQGKQLLRAKQIRGIAFSNARSEIIVFTKLRAPTTSSILAVAQFPLATIETPEHCLA